MQIKTNNKSHFKKKKKGNIYKFYKSKMNSTLQVTVYLKKYFTTKSLALLPRSVLCTGSLHRLTAKAPSQEFVGEPVSPQLNSRFPQSYKLWKIQVAMGSSVLETPALPAAGAEGCWGSSAPGRAGNTCSPALGAEAAQTPVGHDSH